jgi:hypothetical protein
MDTELRDFLIENGRKSGEGYFVSYEIVICTGPKGAELVVDHFPELGNRICLSSRSPRSEFSELLLANITMQQFVALLAAFTPDLPKTPEP